MPVLHKAETVFQAKHYDAAAALYDEAIHRAPRCYVAQAYRGDASFFAGDWSTALTYYDAALKLNPDDGAIYLFRSNALARLHRLPEALDALRWSLALRPRNPNVLHVLDEVGRELKAQVQSVEFEPRGFARKVSDAKVTVTSDPAKPYWLGYATCKAFWLGEPSHREEMTGDRRYRFSNIEEAECLAALLTAYEGQRQDKTKQVEPDPAIEALERLAKAHWLNEWVVYELASRLDPQVVLTLPLEARQRMFEFVRTQVVVDTH
jgi:tetratricopeptide (TPR) repeat protein